MNAGVSHGTFDERFDKVVQISRMKVETKIDFFVLCDFYTSFMIAMSKEIRPLENEYEICLV